MASALIWMETALRDLEGVAALIAQDSPYFAAATVDAVVMAAEALRDFPQSGRVVPEYGNPDLREILSGNYRIVYRVLEKEVAVLAITHGSRPLAPGMRSFE